MLDQTTIQARVDQDPRADQFTLDVYDNGITVFGSSEHAFCVTVEDGRVEVGATDGLHQMTRERATEIYDAIGLALTATAEE